MSLQTRLGALITAIGADIKALYAGKVDANDSRLSDARTPTAHSHAITNVTGLQTALDAKADASVLGDISAALTAINGV